MTPSHLDLTFSLERHSALSEMQNLKLRLASDVIDFYRKYPTLHSIHMHYSYPGWNTGVSQIAWDSVPNIYQSEDYKASKLVMYAYLFNAMSGKRDLPIIECNDGTGSRQWTTANVVDDEIKQCMSYLNECSDVAELLKNDVNACIDKQRLQKGNDSGVKNTIRLVSCDFFGMPVPIEPQIIHFLGQEIMSCLLNRKLDNVLNDKEDKAVQGPRVKI